MKLPEKLPPVPRLSLHSARWVAVCGRCLARSRIVSALAERDAWNEIASHEGWCAFEPGPGFEPYPLCLACAEAELAVPAPFGADLSAARPPVGRRARARKRR